jgi:hypothetical protein
MYSSLFLLRQRLKPGCYIIRYRPNPLVGKPPVAPGALCKNADEGAYQETYKTPVFSGLTRERCRYYRISVAGPPRR